MKDSSARPAKRAGSEVEIELVKPQQQPSPLVFAGGRLAQLRSSALVVRRAPDFGEELRIAVDTAQGLGALSDGSLVVLEAKAESRVLKLAPGARDARPYRGYVPTAHRAHSRVFAGPAAGSVVLATRSGDVTVDRCDLVEPDRLQRSDRFELQPDDFDTLTALDGGTFACASVRDGGLLTVGFGRARSAVKLGGDAIPARHVVAGPGRTAWVSGRKGGLFLISVADGRTIARSSPAAGQIYHLARAGARVAALLLDQGGARKRTASLAVFDDKAAEVWRTKLELPEEMHFTPRWVAGSDKHIAVGHAAELTVFDAASGQKLV